MKLIRLWTVSIAVAVISFVTLPALASTWIGSLDTASPILFMSAFAQAVQFHEASIMFLAAWMVPAALGVYVLSETLRRGVRLVSA